jgi:competence protein ComEA
MNFVKKYKGFIVLIIGLIGIAIYNFDLLPNNQNMEVDQFSSIQTTTVETEETGEYIMVDIKGEINYPGLYKISSNLRVGDIIELAGGATNLADLTSINLAMKLSDEMIITIPKKSNISDNYPDVVRIVVEIKGEVVNPGTYSVPLNTRLENLINEAGGLTDLADVENINLSLLIEDEMVITIPKKNNIYIDEDYIFVEIKGEVNKPGVYQVEVGYRVFDLINLSGGLTTSANTESIEMAKVLTDGETVIIDKLDEINNQPKEIYVEIYGEINFPGKYYIPETYSLTDLIYEAGGVTINCDLSKIDWDISLCLGAVINIPSYDDEVPTNDSNNNLININTADLETLMTLKGIGEILGQRIIDYRNENGPFLNIEDIMLVSGIKATIYEDIKAKITV